MSNEVAFVALAQSRGKASEAAAVLHIPRVKDEAALVAMVLDVSSFIVLAQDASEKRREEQRPHQDVDGRTPGTSVRHHSPPNPRHIAGLRRRTYKAGEGVHSHERKPQKRCDECISQHRDYFRHGVHRIHPQPKRRRPLQCYPDDPRSSTQRQQQPGQSARQRRRPAEDLPSQNEACAHCDQTTYSCDSRGQREEGEVFMHGAGERSEAASLVLQRQHARRRSRPPHERAEAHCNRSGDDLHSRGSSSAPSLLPPLAKRLISGTPPTPETLKIVLATSTSIALDIPEGFGLQSKTDGRAKSRRCDELCSASSAGTI